MRRTVLAAADGLEVIDPLAAPDARQDVVLLRLTVGWNQNADRPADQLGSGIPEHPFGAQHCTTG